MKLKEINAREKIAESMVRKALMKAIRDMDNFEKEQGRELTVREAITKSAESICTYIEGYTNGMISMLEVIRTSEENENK